MGADVLFCIPDRIKCILVFSVMAALRSSSARTTRAGVCGPHGACGTCLLGVCIPIGHGTKTIYCSVRDCRLAPAHAHVWQLAAQQDLVPIHGWNQ
jgi:hypothetical protein